MRPFVHRIDGADEIAAASASSKMDTRWAFLTQLRDIGSAAAKTWLENNYDALGKESTLDLGVAYNRRSCFTAVRFRPRSLAGRSIRRYARRSFPSPRL